jgi:hypothetical protein
VLPASPFFFVKAALRNDGGQFQERIRNAPLLPANRHAWQSNGQLTTTNLLKSIFPRKPTAYWARMVLSVIMVAKIDVIFAR